MNNSEKPFAYMWQHNETGRTGFIDQWQIDNGFLANNCGISLITPLYTGQAKTRELLQNLVAALDSAYISSWQSTAAWQTQLDEARDYLGNFNC